MHCVFMECTAAVLPRTRTHAGVLASDARQPAALDGTVPVLLLPTASIGSFVGFVCSINGVNHELDCPSSDFERGC